MGAPSMLQDTVAALHGVANELASKPGAAIDINAAHTYVVAIDEYQHGLDVLPPARLQSLDSKAVEAAQHANKAQSLIQQGNWGDALDSVFSAIGALPGEPGLWPRKVPRPTRP